LLCISYQALNTLRRLCFWIKDVRDAEHGASEMARVGHEVLDLYRRTHTEEQKQKDSSIIAHLIRSPYPSEHHRVADVTIFMLAGHDTTAYSLSWIIIELSKHPEVVRKLRVELDKIMPPEGPVGLSPQHLSKLDYLTKVIKEGMRVWPVVPSGIVRTLLHDIQYKDAVLPKYSTAAVNQFAMNRIGVRQPDDFIPERWNDDDPESPVLKNLFMPFALGKRSCIGQNLAMLELKLVLATLYYLYDFELLSEIREDLSVTLKPRNANFRVTRRVR
jgi:cytochrome P450